jgi:hypothetical protein
MIDVTGIGSAVSSVTGLAKSLVDRFLPPTMGEADKAKAQIEMQELLQNYETTLINTQKDIIVSEMSQQDTFTKRARPTVVYAGLAFIFLVNVFFPIVIFATKGTAPELSLPQEFWWSWSGVVGTWIVGRSAERITGGNSVTRVINGKP